MFFLSQKSSNLLFFIHLLSVAERLWSKPSFLPFFFCAGNLPELPGLLESIGEEEVIDAAVGFLKLVMS